MRKIKKQSGPERKQTAQEIESIVQKVTAFYDRYRKQGRIALAAVLALLVAIGGYSLYQANSERKASALLAPALDLYGSTEPDLGKAMDLFREIRTGYPRTLSGSIARYYEGNCLAGLGRMQEAVDMYREVSERAGAGSMLRGMAYQRMGYAFKTMGSMEEAIKAFEAAESLKGTGMATLELARLYDRSGRAEESQNKYRTLADSMPGTSLAEEAKRMIKGEASAGQEGVKKTINNADAK